MDKITLTVFTEDFAKLCFMCHVCDDLFLYEDDLKDHVKEHGNTKCYVCVACDAAFTEAVDLHRHECDFTEDSPHSEKYMASLNDSSNHSPLEETLLTDDQQNHEVNPPKPEEHLKHNCVKKQNTMKCNVCGICGVIFDIESSFLCHRMEHQMEYCYCDICERKLRGYRLRKHIMTHARRFSCTQCDKMFSNKRFLQKHQQVHSKSENGQLSEVGLTCEKGKTISETANVHQSGDGPTGHSSPSPVSAPQVK
nr:zinc finger protein 99-like [Procambarus clarkii]